LLLGWRGGGGSWRDTPQVRPCRLGHGIHAVDGPASCPLPAFDNFPMTVGGSTPCVDEVYRKARRGRIRFPMENGSDPNHQHAAVAVAVAFRSSSFSSCGAGHRKLSGAGWVGWAGVSAAWARGMPRAGWAGRPTPVLPCAQDSAHEQAAAKPTRTYLRRPPNSPPTQPRQAIPLLPTTAEGAQPGGRESRGITPRIRPA